MVSLGQKLNWPKTCTKRLYKKTTVVLCKNRWKKHQIFDKLVDFKNGPSSKGYSVCKMVSLGQKLKCVKRCEKHMYKHTRVVLCKKPLEKKKYSRNETILKIGHVTKAIAFAKC